MAFVSPVAMVTGPLSALLAFQRPGRRETFVAAGLMALTAWGWSGADGFGRVAAAWVLLLTGSVAVALLVRPPSRTALVGGGLTSVGVAALVGTVLVGVTRFSFGELHWLATRHFSAQARALVEVLGGSVGTSTTPEFLGMFETSALSAVEGLAWLLPGLLLLQSLAALGLAWTLYRAIAREPVNGPLPALRDFRFNDHLVWGMVLALLFLVVPRLAVLQPVGGNLAAFFGGLYVVRGVAVLTTMLQTAGVGAVGGFLFGLFVTIFLLPVALVVALGLGLTDTWVDWRLRVRQAKAGRKP